MRKLQWLIIALITVSLSIAVYNWKHPRQQFLKTTTFIGLDEGQDQALTLVQVLLDQKSIDQALTIIHSYDRYITSATPKGRRWLALLVEALTQAQNGAQLNAVWDYFPEAFKDNEKAVILLGRNMIAKGRSDEYQTLRKMWQGKEKIKNEWFLLDADALSSHGDRIEAIKFLDSQKFNGPEDAERLVRLAAEEVKDHPQKAWERLNEAVTIDPKNILVHLYRARFLEAVGKTQHALAEYVTLVRLYPQSIMFKDQLVDFFLRHEYYKEALAVLKETLKAPTSGYIWLKTYFWSKVAMPVVFDWKNNPIPEGNLTPLLKYLSQLPKNTFWNDQAFNDVIAGKQYLKSEQFTLWLRIIQNLVDEKEKEALELLQVNTFSPHSYHPQLENGMLQILNYRVKKTLATDKIISVYLLAKNEETPPFTGEESETEFFERLNKASAKKDESLDKDLVSIITSPEAPAVAFLAAHWYEAAAALHRLDIYPSNFPIWMTLEMGKALQITQGPDKALAFLDKQTKNTQIELVKAEIFIAEKKIDKATELLMAIKNVPEEAGKNATWILCMLNLEAKKEAKAEELLNERQDLAQSTQGQEIYAKIALARHQTDKADAIYKKISDDSVEAKSYLARIAFEKNDLDQAHKLTVDLLQKNPNNVVLRVNLEQIIAKQKEQTQGKHE